MAKRDASQVQSQVNRSRRNRRSAKTQNKNDSRTNSLCGERGNVLPCQSWTKKQAGSSQDMGSCFCEELRHFCVKKLVRKNGKTCALVFSSLWPWYGFSIPTVSFHRFGMILETHTALTSLLFTDQNIQKWYCLGG